MANFSDLNVTMPEEVKEINFEGEIIKIKQTNGVVKKLFIERFIVKPPKVLVFYMIPCRE